MSASIGIPAKGVIAFLSMSLLHLTSNNVGESGSIFLALQIFRYGLPLCKFSVGFDVKQFEEIAPGAFDGAGGIVCLFSLHQGFLNIFWKNLIIFWKNAAIALKNLTNPLGTTSSSSAMSGVYLLRRSPNDFSS